MARFSEDGNDMYICQICGRDLDSVKHQPVWRAGTGNVCPSCQQTKVTMGERPISLFDHCQRESGLIDPEAIRRYMSRHYGHG
jgi:hypothetical protein